MKQSAFTLIELLVVIVIIGVLATISTATFSGYSKKARSAKAIVEVGELFSILDLEAIDDQESADTNFWGDYNNSYNYTVTPGILMDMWEEAGIKTDISKSNGGMQRMFQQYHEDDTMMIVFGSGGNSPNSREDNDFAIVGWGDGVSTFDPNESGVLVWGTPRMKKAIEENLSSFTKSSFQSTGNGYLTTQRILYRHLCAPSSVYTFYLKGTVSPGTAGVVATGVPDRNSSTYYGTSSMNNSVCPY